jgi:hypothetical protein
MKKDKPHLFKSFTPSIDQVTYMIVSNNKDILTPDNKRKTRSYRASTPCDKYPANLESLESILKKRDNKDKAKKQEKEQKTTNKVQKSLAEKLDEQILEDKPKACDILFEPEIVV